MSLVLRMLSTVVGPKLTAWCVGAVAGLGGVLALLVARHKGRAQGRAEVLAENARAEARRRAELAKIKENQVKAANARPDRADLERILEEGKF